MPEEDQLDLHHYYITFKDEAGVKKMLWDTVGNKPIFFSAQGAVRRAVQLRRDLPGGIHDIQVIRSTGDGYVPTYTAVAGSGNTLNAELTSFHMTGESTGW